MDMEVEFQPIKKRRQIWLFIVFMILLGAGLAWLIFNQRLAYPPLSSSDPSSESPPANNKNYRSEKFDLAFDYPEDWTVNEKEDALGLVSSASLWTMSKDRGGINPEYTDITVEWRENTEKLSLEDFAQKYDAGLSEKYGHKKTIKIAGKKALDFRDTIENADQFPVLLIFIKKSDEQIVLITLHWFFDLGQNNLAPIFDTLISTLVLL